MLKLSALMDDAEPDVLAFMTFPKDHRSKIQSINPLGRYRRWRATQEEHEAYTLHIEHRRSTVHEF
jgi:transposase-like protein